MTQKIFVERDLLQHPAVLRLKKLYPQARLLSCSHYGEVFNPKAQDFKLQKQNPAWIIARKRNRFVLPAPKGFGIGGQANFYFSHLLNCPYDCRYCFLQGMYRSAHYVWFVNHEDFKAAISQTILQHPSQHCFFFSGYDGDSLALEPITQFAAQFIEFFSQQQATLELRTKSVNVRSLLKLQASPRVVVAFSLTPELMSRQVEHKVPPLQRRLQAMAQLAAAGWPIGLRFDPVIDMPDFVRHYQQLLEDIFRLIKPAQVHSVSFGPLRFPPKMLTTIQRYYPQDPMLASVTDKRAGQYAYTAQREREILQQLRSLLLHYVSPAQLFTCYDACTQA